MQVGKSSVAVELASKASPSLTRTSEARLVQRCLILISAPGIAVLATAVQYARVPDTEAQACEFSSLDQRNWVRARVADAPVTLLVPPSSHRSHVMEGALDRQTWTLGGSALRMSVEEDSTKVPHAYNDEPPIGLARLDGRRCVAMLGTRSLHITTYRDALSDKPYRVDGVLPLVRREGILSWLLFGSESPDQKGRDTVLAAMFSLRLDSAGAESSHASTPCAAPTRAGDEATWVWHQLHFAPLWVLGPRTWEWVYTPGEHFEAWGRHSPRPGPFADEAFNYDVRRMPTWQIPTADPPFALVCRTRVAGRVADVVIDTLLTGHSGPGLVTNYSALAYVQIGQDSVLRIAAGISDDPTPPSLFLRMLSHMHPDSVAR
jgi:hypothetical protein